MYKVNLKKAFLKPGRVLSLACLCSLLVGCVSTPSPDTDSVPPANPELKINHEKAALLNAELGIAYLEKGQVSRAKTKLLRARELAPHLAAVHYSMAYFLETVGDIDDADAAYKRALSIDPLAGEANNNYGTFLCRQKRYLDAEKYFIVAIEDKNYIETAAVLENAGICLSKTKEQMRAQSYFERATKHDPRRPGPWLELAYMHLEAGDIDDARFYYEQYESLPHPAIPRGLFVKRQLARHLGNADEQASAELLLRSQFPQAQETLDIEVQ